MSLRHWALVLAAALPAGAGEGDGLSPEQRAAYARDVVPFLKAHCFECHGEKVRKAGLRLDDLGTDFLAGKTADVWKEVIDHVNLGKMPPEKQPRPDPRKAFAVVEWVGKELRRAESAARSAGGRILLRRLNRSEYANTVRDLLQLDDNVVRQIREALPTDSQAEGFDRLGAALLFDETLLKTYLRVAGETAEKALVDPAARPQTRKNRLEFEELETGRKRSLVFDQLPDTAVPPGPSPLEKKRGGIEFINTNTSGGDKTWAGFGPGVRVAKEDSVSSDGYYTLRFRAGAFRGERGEPIRIQYLFMQGTPMALSGEIEVKGTLEAPDVVETTVFLRKPIEGGRTTLRLAWNGLTDVIQTHPEIANLVQARKNAQGVIRQLATTKGSEAEVAAARAEIERLDEAARVLAKKPGITGRAYNPKHDLAKIPRLWVDWGEIEGPVEKAWPPASHTAVLPDGLPADEAGVRKVFARFLPRAYRRPVTDADLDRIMGVVRRGRETFGLSPLQAVRQGLQAALTSPDFLFLFEPSASSARRLADMELASRLSYFLWSTMPDDALFAAASAGRLRDPQALRAEVRRMLADPKSRALVEDFTGQWLHVREFGSVMPDRAYRDYDEALEEAEREEPYAFFEEVLRKDLPIPSFLDSDFAMVNERLARFYGIDGVKGPEFRRVALKPEHRRGGVLTMGGLLTYLADGTRTLPVRRGAWILEQIFNDPPPPPPPDAGEIQPNAAGANLTVRERLEKHRNEPTCASCHVKIDPLGLALENYDAIGAWRELQNGEGFKGRNLPKIDASGTLPDGRAFDSPAAFKKALLEEKDRFARAFTEKLLTYALGRPVGYTDRSTVEAVVKAAAADGYRLQSLIQAVVASEAFQTK